jgi:hypothetical protein
MMENELLKILPQYEKCWIQRSNTSVVITLFKERSYEMRFIKNVLKSEDELTMDIIIKGLGLAIVD